MLTVPLSAKRIARVYSYQNLPLGTHCTCPNLPETARVNSVQPQGVRPVPLLFDCVRASVQWTSARCTLTQPAMQSRAKRVRTLSTVAIMHARIRVTGCTAARLLVCRHLVDAGSVSSADSERRRDHCSAGRPGGGQRGHSRRAQRSAGLTSTAPNSCHGRTVSWRGSCGSWCCTRACRLRHIARAAWQCCGSAGHAQQPRCDGHGVTRCDSVPVAW